MCPWIVLHLPISMVVIWDNDLWIIGCQPMKDIENHLVVDELWEDEKIPRCRFCGELSHECNCECIE